MTGPTTPISTATRPIIVPLSPLGFIARTAAVYPDRLAVVHGARRYSWAETYRALPPARRARSRARGIGKNDTVAVMAPTRRRCFEAHFGVPMAGAVLNALNIRLDADDDRLHPASTARPRC